jgi:hypothetical protein
MILRNFFIFIIMNRILEKNTIRFTIIRNMKIKLNDIVIVATRKFNF